jgi:hypothetical protein
MPSEGLKERLVQYLLLALVLLLGVAAVFAAELWELSPWVWWPLRAAYLLFAIWALRRAKIVQD